jgi:hypothetical protein
MIIEVPSQLFRLAVDHESVLSRSGLNLYRKLFSESPELFRDAFC